jgi:hypothetical protein
MTKPDRSRCRTMRSAAIEAAIASASWTRFRPDHRRAKLIDSATSSGLAGVRSFRRSWRQG